MTGDPPSGGHLAYVGWLTDYDRDHIAVYSALLRAARAGRDWKDAARSLLALDVAADEAAAHAIWQAHLVRARWFWEGGDA